MVTWQHNNWNIQGIKAMPLGSAILLSVSVMALEFGWMSRVRHIK
jgi:hypothetical protein